MRRRRRKRKLDPNKLHLFKQILLGFVVLILISGIVAGVWYGSRINSLTIQSVKVSGGDTVDHEKIEDLVRLSLEGSYLGLIPRRFAWFYPEEELSKKVQEIEKVKKVNVDRVSSTEISVTFTEYIPQALWCESASSSMCVYLDSKGYAFSNAPHLEGGSFLRLTKIGKEPQAGTSILPADEYLVLNDLVRQLNHDDWNVNLAIVDRGGDAYLQTTGGGEFKVSLNQSSDDTVHNLETLLNSPEYEHLSDNSFLYIDLRFGNKLFIKETENPIDPEEEPLDIIKAIMVDSAETATSSDEEIEIKTTEEEEIENSTTTATST